MPRTCELVWLKSLLADLTIPVATPIPLHVDNLSTISLASNPVLHARTKHIEVDCHFVRDKLQENFLKLIFVPSHQQLANVFTKPLGRSAHWHILFKLGLHNPCGPPICREGNSKDVEYEHEISANATSEQDTSTL